MNRYLSGCLRNGCASISQGSAAHGMDTHVTLGSMSPVFPKHEQMQEKCIRVKETRKAR